MAYGEKYSCNALISLYTVDDLQRGFVLTLLCGQKRYFYVLIQW